ncbi:uncharacterized protein LOC126741565 [Anthonomus grandis grandis]|uniref:uncharacterized protein LOC126741565 n=1 Tax=Anthonomus grandis grandis TaxID=2921223 RepID=UPI0021653999|nr:uncharacterized protein LOC126741565 [Anthonomus grandis grandis]
MMSSSELFEGKNGSFVCLCKSFHDSRCNAGTFLSPPISREALKRLNSTSSHSSASDWSPGTPCEVQEKPLVRGQRHLKKAISLEEIFYKKGNKKRKHLQRRTSDYNIKSYEITLERKSSKRRKRSSRSKNSNSTRDTSQGQCDIESGHLDNNIMFANSSKNLSKQSPRSKVQEDIQQSIEEVSRHKRRRRIINIILAVYFFIFCISILSVVVTLTHQSTTTIIGKNSTKNLTYYTFSPKSDVLLEDIS